MRQKIKIILGKVENYPFGWRQLSVWLAAVLAIRNILESFSDGGGRILDWQSFFLYYPAFYLSLFLSLALVVKLFSGRNILIAVKMIFVFSFIVWLPPLVDLLFPFWSNMSYIGVSGWGDFFQSFIRLGLGGIYGQGASLGIKFELVVATVGLFGYFIFCGKNLLRALAGAIAAYAVIILHGLAPSILAWPAHWRGGETVYNDRLIALFFLLLSIVWVIFIIRLFARQKLKDWFFSLDWFRVFLVWIMLGLGAGVYLSQRLDQADSYNNFEFYAVRFLALLALGLIMWQIGRTMNDWNDYFFDKESGNPNLLDRFSRTEIKTMLGLYLLFATGLSAVIGYDVFVMLAAYLLIGYAYCFPPLHLKKRFIFSALALAIDYLLAFWIGYAALFAAGDSLSLMPFRFSFLAFAVSFLIVGIKDVKDERGDLLQGVDTIVTRFGRKKSAPIIGAMIFVALLLPGFFIGYQLFLSGLLCFAAISFITGKFQSISRRKEILAAIGGYLILSLVLCFLSAPSYPAGRLDLARDAGWHPAASSELWLASGFLADDNGNNYYWSQIYNPKVGNFLSVVDLSAGKIYRHQSADGGLAATKNNFSFFQPTADVFDFSTVKSENPFFLSFKSPFTGGRLSLAAEQAGKEFVLLSDSGRLSLPKGGEADYYVLPDLRLDGKLVFFRDKFVRLSGSGRVAHLWGDLSLDYKRWLAIDANFSAGKKVSILIFDYDTESAVYGAITEAGKTSYFSLLSIEPVNFWESEKTGDIWPKEVRIKNDDVGFDLTLKAILPDQEIAGHRIWDGIMTVTGNIAGETADGWASWREIRAN